jgi:hypothetical protein
MITVEPSKWNGQPCIRGMRITVRDVLEYLAGGMTIEELLADFPERHLRTSKSVSHLASCSSLLNRFPYAVYF